MSQSLQERLNSLTKIAEELNNELYLVRQREVLLQESERRYRAIFDNAGIGLAQLGPDRRFMEVNQTFCSILGYSRSELLGKIYDNLADGAESENHETLLQQLLEGRIASVGFERRYRRKDGTLLWCISNLSTTRAGLNEAPLFLVAIENVNERHSLQDALGRIANNLLRTKALPLSGTWTYNMGKREVAASREVFLLFGLQPSSRPVPLDTFLNRIHPGDRQIVADGIERAISDRRAYQLEYRLKLIDGTERVVSAGGEWRQSDPASGPLTMIGVIQDITALRSAERMMRESEQRFREIFENAVDGILIADIEGAYIQANPSACRMLGYAADEFVGKPITDLFPEEEKARLPQTKEYFLQNAGRVQLAEWHLVHKDGSYIPVEISARFLPSGRWIAIVRDIRERKRVQAELESYAAEIRDIYDNAPCGYHSLDPDGTVTQMNKTELDWLGYAADEVIGKKKLVDLLAEGSRAKYEGYLPALKRDGMARDIEFARKDGTIFPALLTASAAYDDRGNFIKSRDSVFDMTELSKANQKLRQAAAVFEHTKDAILITGSDGRIVAVNNAFSRITGYSPEEVIGRNPRLMKSENHDDAFYRNFWESIDKTGTWQGEIWDRRKSGEVFPAWESITAVKDASGRVTDYISVFSDITTIKESERKLVRLAYHDPLTGLPNRLLFNDRLSQALARTKRHQGHAALLLLDLDRFKLINDTLGHAAGDQLLQVVAGRLKEAIRHEDTVARLGGDEFAIVLTQLEHPEEAALLAEKIVEIVSQPIHIMSQALRVSTSIGIGIYPDDADDPEAQAKCADMAMYGAKSKGKNAYEFYTREMTAVATETLVIDHGLRNALKLQEFALYYQPQIRLSDERIVGVEALIRWNRPGHGVEEPTGFIGVAEETDLIEVIGEWVLNTACIQLERWRASGISPLRIAVNIPVRQVRKASFVREMRTRMLALQPMDGFSLDLEITETTLQTEPDVIDVLKDLKPLGIKLAIDDFGTGYSSLSSLKHLPVDILKIDRSFVQGIPSDENDKAIASAIIAMGHRLGMSVLAEGIESAEQCAFLMEQGCDEAQGFFYSPPLNAEECEQLLLQSDSGVLKGRPSAGLSLTD